MFQMGPLALMTHLESPGEVLHDTNAFFFFGGTNPANYGILEFSNSPGLVFVDSVLQKAPQVKVWGTQIRHCTAWAAISKHGIIGPFWFENDSGQAVTVNATRYITVLDSFWRELETFPGVQTRKQWLQQDGATPHTANIAMDWLREHFGDRFISRRHSPEWAPVSPDLSPPDFYLWCFLKA